MNYKNYEPVLNELKEYVTEGDPDFVRRSMRAISKIAIRFEKSIDKCLEILAKQIKEVREVAEHASHAVNELLTVSIEYNSVNPDNSEKVPFKVQLRRYV